MNAPRPEGGADATTVDDSDPTNPRRPRWFGLAVRAGAAVALSVGLSLGSVGAEADPVDPFTEIAAGPEGSLSDSLAAVFPELVRLADDEDESWMLPATAATIEARPIIRHAGYASEFGIAILGESGPGAFHSVFAAPGPTDWEATDLPWLDLGVALTPGEGFAFGIRTPHRTMLSQAASNADGLDHMVTWFDPDDPGRYVFGFEDTPGGGDWDFNDLVVEVRFIELAPEPATIAEPASAALYGVGFAVIALVSTVRCFWPRFLGN